MADKKISQLPEKTSLDDPDEFAIVDSGTGITKRITTANAKIHLNAVWDDDGTDVKTDNDPRNVDLQSGGLKDTFVTTAIKLGDGANTSFDTANKTILGAVNELKTDLDGFPDELKNLTTAEIQQLENIGTTTIASVKWQWLGALDQSLSTGDDAIFNGVDVTNIGLTDGIVITNAVGQFLSSTSLPDGTTGTTQSISDNSTRLATTAFVQAQGTAVNEFSELTDVTRAYTNAFALYRTNQAALGLEESTTLLTEPAANQFTLTRGTTALTMQDDLTVEASSAINQDLTTDGIAQFGRLQLNGSGGSEKLNIFGGNIQLENDFSLKFFNTFEGLDSPFIKCDSNNDLIIANDREDITLIAAGAIMIRAGSAETSAALQINGTVGALLLSRMTETQRDALTPVNGMMIYNLTVSRLQKYQNDSWISSEGTEDFKDLTDVKGAYTTGKALYRTNVDIDGLEETDVTLTLTGDTQFTFARGTGSLDVNGDIFLNQTLRTTDTPTFDGMHLNSVTHGLLLPRMTTTQRDNNVTPQSGLMIYNTTEGRYEAYTSSWKRIVTSST